MKIPFTLILLFLFVPLSYGWRQNSKAPSPYIIPKGTATTEDINELRSRVEELEKKIEEYKAKYSLVVKKDPTDNLIQVDFSKVLSPIQRELRTFEQTSFATSAFIIMVFGLLAYALSGGRK